MTTITTIITTITIAATTNTNKFEWMRGVKTKVCFTSNSVLRRQSTEGVQWSKPIPWRLLQMGHFYGNKFARNTRSQFYPVSPGGEGEVKEKNKPQAFSANLQIESET